MNSRLQLFLRSIFLALLITGLGSTAFAQTFAYVVESASNNIAVIDTSTMTLVTEIPVSEPRLITMSPDGTHVYAGSVQRSSFGVISFYVVAIDTATNSVVANIPVSFLSSLTVSPDSTKVYGSASASGGLNVIDAATNSIASTIALPHSAGGIAVSPDGTRLYAGSGPFGEIYIVDTATNALIDTIPAVSAGPGTARSLGSIALSPDGTRLYGSNEYRTSVYDTATNIEIASIEQPDMANMAITPDGLHIWGCGPFDGGPFFVMDTTALSTTRVSDAASAWYQAAIAPDGALAYVVDGLNNTVVAWDTTTLLPVSLVQLAVSHPPAIPGSRPRDIAVGNVPPVVAFAAFNTSKLQINSQGFSDAGSFTAGVGHAAAASVSTIDPVTQDVTLTVGSYTLTVPHGSFHKDGTNLHWKLEGTIGSVRVNADIKQQNKSTTQFDYSFDVKGPNLTSEPHPIRTTLKIGKNIGAVSVP